MKQGPPDANELGHALAIIRLFGVQDPDQAKELAVVRSLRIYAEARRKGRKVDVEMERQKSQASNGK